MNVLKKLIVFVVDSWNVVMDNRYNPLRHIHDPSLQVYFTLALFIMWSGYFGALAAYYMEWLGYSVVNSIVIHLAVFIPLMVTRYVFKEAEQNGHVWVQEWRNIQLIRSENSGKFDKQKVAPYRDGDNT
tara:strand:- start:347 stop:733 length:387 start_codon:yes stop_codon:yes gene_type:complete